MYIMIVLSVECVLYAYLCCFVFFFSSRRRHTRCALVTGVQTCALPISAFCRPMHSRDTIRSTHQAESLRLDAGPTPDVAFTTSMPGKLRPSRRMCWSRLARFIKSKPASAAVRETYGVQCVKNKPNPP